MKHLKDTSAAALSPQRKIHFDYPWLSAAVPLVVLMIVLPLANPRFLTVSNQRSSAGGGICHHGVGYVFRTDDRRN